MHLARSAHLAIVGHLLDGMPDEACGLLAGPLRPTADPPSGIDADVRHGSSRDVRGGSTGATEATRFYPTANAAASSRIYTVEPRDHLRADRDAEDRGLEILGVVHSHTHTEPYPSPTDVAQAPDPAWHYVIVSFRTGVAALRSYRIVDGSVQEEPVVVVEG
nr:M67 family metallopeptidase [Rhabdothermincola salaria]